MRRPSPQPQGIVGSLYDAALVEGEKSVIALGRTSPRSGISHAVFDMFVLKVDAASGEEIWRYQVRLNSV